MNACIVIPVLNEEEQLVSSVCRVHDALMRCWGPGFSLVIADNGSTDATPHIAAELAHQYSEVEVLRLDKRGRGGALRSAWLGSMAEVLAYMDVDLSTNLVHLSELLKAIASDRCDIVIGSRLLRKSQVERCFKREVLSLSLIHI